MEALFNELQAALAEANTDKATTASLQAKADELAAYYASDEWKADFLADEQGLLPKDLPRGVLSEDGIYNLLEKEK